MPYAAENQVSTDPLDGGIEITQGQYQQAIAGMLEGKIVTIDGGFAVVDPPAHEDDPAPEPEPAPPYVPQQVTRAQGKAALIQAGLWSAVESFVDSIADPTEKALALVALNDTTHWRRDSPFLNAAATALGLTGEQLDDLFIQAATIEL